MATLLVASTGGHLAQLHRLWPRLRAAGLDPDPVWVTFDSPQSRSLLAGERVELLRYIAPRDVRSTLRNLGEVRRILRRHRFGHAVSTGSGIALAVLPSAVLAGVSCHYVESAARSSGPSLSGRALRRVPGVRTYTQYQSWASPSWPYVGSIFDDFEARDRPQAPPVRTVLVTLGTIPFAFARLVERVRAIVPADVRVIWQTGHTAADAGPDAHATLPQAQLRALCAEADVVVAHAGIGSALMALEAGRTPVLVPRQHVHGEHVDDHQSQIASELARRGLAVHADASALTWRDVVAAAGHDVSAPQRIVPFPI